MKRLPEHNSEMFEKYGLRTMNVAGLSGVKWCTSDVACPKCEEEVAMMQKVDMILTTYPPKVKVRCPKCKLEAYKIV